MHMCFLTTSTMYKTFMLKGLQVMEGPLYLQSSAQIAKGKWPSTP